MFVQPRHSAVAIAHGFIEREAAGVVSLVEERLIRAFEAGLLDPRVPGPTPA
jgi:hypothetical protein